MPAFCAPATHSLVSRTFARPHLPPSQYSWFSGLRIKVLCQVTKYLCSAFAISLSLHVKFLNIMRKTRSILTHTTVFLALEKDSHPIIIDVFVGETIYLLNVDTRSLKSCSALSSSSVLTWRRTQPVSFIKTKHDRVCHSVKSVLFLPDLNQTRKVSTN